MTRYQQSCVSANTQAPLGCIVCFYVSIKINMLSLADVADGTPEQRQTYGVPNHPECLPIPEARHLFYAGRHTKCQWVSYSSPTESSLKPYKHSTSTKGQQHTYRACCRYRCYTALALDRHHEYT